MRTGLIILAAAVVVTLGGVLSSIPATAGPPKPQGGAAAVATPSANENKKVRIPEGDFRPRKRLGAASIAAQGETHGWMLKEMGVRAETAWGLSKNKGKGVKVAILDTGVDAAHSEFRTNGVSRVTKVADFTDSPAGPRDTVGHGTHCAGILGMGENGAGYVGVAPEVEIISGKVLADDRDLQTYEMVRLGVEWAIDEKVDIISMSFGAGPDNTPPAQFEPRLYATIKRATKAGIIVVVAAGNDGDRGDFTVNFPGRYPEVIAVASSDVNQNVSHFSSKGPEVDVAAPGEDIWSTLPGGQYGVESGTSMATPCVAGVAALYVGSRKAAGAEWSIDEFRELIKTTSFTRQGNPPTHTSGYGIIQAPAFVKKGKPSDKNPPVEGKEIILNKIDVSFFGNRKLIQENGLPDIDGWKFKYVGPAK